ncbi:deoxyribonuclease-2-alpha [Teleopsis dalmanni]|uniref:deoxyribonuclease-2-alpha n=1 Tax=Teleopsis dalmanni TaxID=139649 RepID=UPI0018CFACC5|nr:deoxyribonuclease-2-alpha [Teleopsis dalmanni]
MINLFLHNLKINNNMINKINVFVCLLCFGSIVKGNLKDGKVSCRDESGSEVDWYYLYKLPKHYQNEPTDTSGLRYLYITSNNQDNWQFSSRFINESTSFPGRTLEAFATDPEVLLIAYNDEFPNNTVVFDHGHTKGVVATDGKTAIWLIHSVPKFPSIPTYEYPKSGEHYGQSFLCLTLPDSEMHKIGQQLIFNEPNIYYTRVPAALKGKYPELDVAIEGKWKTKPPYHNIVDLMTSGKNNFKSFAKSVKYGLELYEDFVAPTLDVNLLVEGWRNGPGNLGSNCSANDKVYNILYIKNQNFDVSFKTTNDHSKWAVSEATGLKIWRWRIGGADWICVGDINRQEHQSVRGGGTVCQKNASVVKLYRELANELEPCS